MGALLKTHAHPPPQHQSTTSHHYPTIPAPHPPPLLLPYQHPTTTPAPPHYHSSSTPPPQQQYNSRHSLLGSSRHDSSEQLTVRHHNGRGNGEYSVFIISAPCTHSEVLSLILVTSTRVARLGKFFNEVTSASLFLRRPTPGPRPYLHWGMLHRVGTMDPEIQVFC